jgi:hypothetical protein
MRNTTSWIFVMVLAACTSYEHGGETLGIERGDTPEAGRPTRPADGGVIPSTGPVPEGCVRIEGDEIGAANLGISVGGVDVEIAAWTSKEGEEGEYVGFELAAGASLAFAVKTGGETHHGEGGSFTHPAGASGPDAPAISNVTFCPGDGESDDDDDLQPLD